MSYIDLGQFRLEHVDGIPIALRDSEGSTVHHLIEEAVLGSHSVAAYCERAVCELDEDYWSPDDDDEGCWSQAGDEGLLSEDL